MDSWPDLVVGRRYAVNVAGDGLVVRPRGVLAEVSGGWARIVHEDQPALSRDGGHSCWIPLDRVVTIAEVEPRNEEAPRKQEQAVPVPRREEDYTRWRRPRLDELTVSVLGA
jgi:hypothetical protein